MGWFVLSGSVCFCSGQIFILWAHLLPDRLGLLLPHLWRTQVVQIRFHNLVFVLSQAPLTLFSILLLHLLYPSDPFPRHVVSPVLLALHDVVSSVFLGIYCQNSSFQICTLTLKLAWLRPRRAQGPAAFPGQHVREINTVSAVSP